MLDISSSCMQEVSEKSFFIIDDLYLQHQIKIKNLNLKKSTVLSLNTFAIKSLKFDFTIRQLKNFSETMALASSNSEAEASLPNFVRSLKSTGVEYELLSRLSVRDCETRKRQGRI